MYIFCQSPSCDSIMVLEQYYYTSACPWGHAWQGFKIPNGWKWSWYMTFPNFNSSRWKWKVVGTLVRFWYLLWAHVNLGWALYLLAVSTCWCCGVIWVVHSEPSSQPWFASLCTCCFGILHIHTNSNWTGKVVLTPLAGHTHTHAHACTHTLPLSQLDIRACWYCN